MSVRIRATLPKGDTNGLTHLESALAEDADRVIVVVGLVRTDTVEDRPHDDDNPRVVKTILLHVEALDGDDAPIAAALMRSTYERRTGKRELPFDEPFADVEGEA